MTKDLKKVAASAILGNTIADASGDLTGLITLCFALLIRCLRLLPFLFIFIK